MIEIAVKTKYNFDPVVYCEVSGLNCLDCAKAVFDILNMLNMLETIKIYYWTDNTNKDCCWYYGYKS